jgi:hypothetical protein
MTAVSGSRQDIFVHFDPPSQEKTDSLSPAVQKIMRIAAYVLIGLGISLILMSGAAVLGVGITATAGFAEGMLSLGIISLISGINIAGQKERQFPNVKEIELGPYTFSLSN